MPGLEPLAGDEVAIAARSSCCREGPPAPRVEREAEHERMRRAQALFERTGRIHAALFDLEGRLVDLREDVAATTRSTRSSAPRCWGERLPLHQTVLLASGRAGYEIVQKALTAAIPVVAAVGAASSLALDVAEWGGMRLFSFVGRETAGRDAFGTDQRRR